MLYDGMRIGVFYESSAWAEKWFEDFFKHIDRTCVFSYIVSYSHPFKIQLKDGTIITAYPANEKSRGVVIDKAFVEPTIKNDVINNIIRPLLGHSQQIIMDV